VTKDGYEVHIRLPYRTADPDAIADQRPQQAEAQAVRARRNANGSRRVRHADFAGFAVSHG
jgi:hypothetical protein